jgi:hypothetical protein
MSIIGHTELAKYIDDLMMCERHLVAENCGKELGDPVKMRSFQLEAQKNLPCCSEKKWKIRDLSARDKKHKSRLSVLLVCDELQAICV